MRKSWSLRIVLLTAGLLAVFAAVAFANTLLTSHTGEMGATWSLHPGYTATSEVTASTGRLRNTTAAYSAYYASGTPTPASADYTVEADMYVASVGGTINVGVIGRMSTTATTFYLCAYYSVGGGWQLWKVVNGTGTQIGATSAATVTSGSTYRLALEMRGSSIKCRVNDVTKASGTDSSITSAGRPGFRLYNTAVGDSSGAQLDNFEAKDTFVLDTFTDSVTPPSGCPVGSVELLPTESFSTEYANTSTGGTLCVNGGTRSMANFTVGKAITIVGVNNAAITQTSSSGALFNVTAANVSIKTLKLTAQNRFTNRDSCGSYTHLISVSASGAVLDGNDLHSACGGIILDNVSSATVQNNTIDNMSYYGIDINSGGGSTSVPIVVTGNTVTNTAVDASLDDNAYGIVASGSPVPHDVNITSNIVDQAPTWECLDTHGGIRVNFLNNTCINAGRQPIVASGATVSRIEGNTLDAADRTSVWNGMINTGADVSGNTMIGNTITNYAGSCAVGSAYYAPNFSGNSARFNSNTCSP